MKPQRVGPYTRCTTVDDDARVHVGGGDDRVHAYDVPAGDWAVWLPHDCDEWLIGSGTPEQTAEQVQLLIESLQEALAVLKAQS